MRLLLDTHIVLWWFIESARVPAEARALIEQSAESVYVSRVSLWEMAIKVSARKLHIDLPLLVAQVEASGFLWLPLENRHILPVAELPAHDDHKDPFDRLLVAQSLTEPAILLTVDARLSRYGTTVRVV